MREKRRDSQGQERYPGTGETPGDKRDTQGQDKDKKDTQGDHRHTGTRQAPRDERDTQGRERHPVTILQLP